MLIVAPCFYPTAEPAKLLGASAAETKLSIYLYGVGDPFIAHGADAQVVRLYEVLQDFLDEIVLVTDCRDVLFLQGESEIMLKYKAYQSPLVMSAERELWPPNQELYDWTPKRKSGYSFINAGQYIGDREYIIICLKHLLDNYRGKMEGIDNSQPWWPLAWMRKEIELKLDHKCEIFQTMSGGAVVEVNDRRVYNPTTNTFPASIHFNGCCGDHRPYEDMYRRIYGKGE